jgi:ATP-dependent protease ClpP protease subunit
MSDNDNQPTQMFPINKSIVVSEVSEYHRVELFIRGQIDPVIEYSDELIKLQYLANKYSVLHVTINTPGGDLMTCLELLRIFKLYSHVVTIGIGEVASAGFILWSAGDIRVIDEYTILMIHRESFGNYGKTAEHLALANVSQVIYGRLYTNTVDKFMTPDEQYHSRISEVWIDAADMVNRGFAIFLSDFESPKRRIMDTTTLYHIDDEGVEKVIMYDELNSVYQFVTIEYTDEYINNLDSYIHSVESIKSIDDAESDVDD